MAASQPGARSKINDSVFKNPGIYRIFSIKRRGRLFKTRPRRPGVYSGPGVYLLNAYFTHPFFIINTRGLLNQEPIFNKNFEKM